MDDSHDGGYDSLSQIRTFYHASPSTFVPGTVLEPQPPGRRNFRCSEAYVYLTDAPAPHYCVEPIAREEGWLVYRVEPLTAVRLGRCDDLVCGRARVLTCLGPASGFRGNSGVVMSSRFHAARAEVVREPHLARTRLAERALGAAVAFTGRGDGLHYEGRVVFADTDTLHVLVDVGGDDPHLVALKDVRVRSLRHDATRVVYGVRLDPWRYGAGWEGIGLADPGVATAILPALCRDEAATVLQ